MGFSVYLICIFLGSITCAGVFFLRDLQSKSTSYKLLFVLLLTVLVFEYVANYLVENHNLPNLVVYNVFFVYLETILLVLYFYRLMTKKGKQLIRVGLIGFLMIGVINSLYFQSITEKFQNISFAVAVLLILSCCIWFFFDIFRLKRYQNVNILSVPEFWITTSILFFYSSGFVYFMPIRYFDTMEMQLLELLSNVNRFLAGLMYLIFGFAFYAPLVFKNE
ncbi:hypothetical protein FKX85_04500 [Echinicola soli]|uniref:Histidine kinase N-terminal 7TM region domain-containing protein n=1 Tax=Echinicola soli TaxID=2591634 RepID=A0A514CEV7_9BACT|nr:hypothetical protein [Echinicola soli]QDH78338.1 hypothetical protein FKX85_04500 [Echinicola soli]